MLKAKDFRYYARESLRGRWLKAGGAGLVAGLFGGAISSGWSSGSSGGGAETGSSSAAGSEVLASLGSGPDVPPMLLAILMGVVLVLLLWAIVILVIGGATTLGYAKYKNETELHNFKNKRYFSKGKLERYRSS